jgi:hypothetical protein
VRTPSEDEVLDFGRGWLERLFGVESRLPVAFAGGAFRSLVSDLPPRDIDLWFPSAEALGDARAALEACGARLERDNPPYQVRYLVEGTPVELVYNVHPPDLDALLGTFDLGPCMMGVARRAGAWSARVHPLAARSFAEGRVLVHREIGNWKYALTSLERLERYAEELSMAVDDADRRWLWALFDGAVPDEQARMVARYLRAGGQDPRILYRARTTGAWVEAA